MRRIVRILMSSEHRAHAREQRVQRLGSAPGHGAWRVRVLPYEAGAGWAGAATWRDWRRGALAAVSAALLAGVIAGWLTPRGPLSAAAGLATMALALLVGLLAGLLMRSRWAMLFAPAAFVLALEVVRLGVDGPTVDGVHLSTYGLIALAVGRGIHGALALVPMALGAALGAGVARRASEGPQTRHGRQRVGLYARRGGSRSSSGSR